MKYDVDQTCQLIVQEQLILNHNNCLKFPIQLFVNSLIYLITAVVIQSISWLFIDTLINMQQIQIFLRSSFKKRH